MPILGYNTSYTKGELRKLSDQNEGKGDTLQVIQFEYKLYSSNTSYTMRRNVATVQQILHHRPITLTPTIL